MGQTMNNSNQTLRFSRTSREAYGYFVRFEPEHHWSEPYLWVACIFAIGFILGGIFL